MTNSSDLPDGAVGTEKLEFLWKTHSYIHDYIRFADAKAGFTAAGATGLLGALVTGKFHERFAQASMGDWPGITWIALLAFSGLAAAVGFAAWTVLPRLWTKHATGYVFWRAIRQHASARDFRDAFSNEDIGALSAHFAEQVYYAADVAEAKYVFSSASILALAVGALMAAAVVLNS